MNVIEGSFGKPVEEDEGPSFTSLYEQLTHMMEKHGEFLKMMEATEYCVLYEQQHVIHMMGNSECLKDLNWLLTKGQAAVMDAVRAGAHELHGGEDG